MPLETTDDMIYELIPKRAVLVGVKLPKTIRFETRMEELHGLAEACNIEVVGEFTQNLDRADAGHYVGKGKIEEIRLGADTLGANLAIFNNTLSPSQLNNLSEALGIEVIDRTNLILNIFAERARTSEARMQVDYAKLRYMLPRLVGLRTNLSRQGGTAGSMSNRGSGEKKIELDRRRIEKRMALLRQQLSEVEQTRLVQRQRRERSGIPLVSLVGYTNAGKSTLLNLMLDTFSPDQDEKRVQAQDMLFATLDTSVRRIEPEGMHPFLLSDTVGFIDDLPTSLIEAFKSTLEEALQADLLLEVIDCSDPEYETHIEVTESTLADLDAGDIPVIHIMNKADRMKDLSELPIVQKSQNGARIWMSAKQGIGLDELLGLIDEYLGSGNVHATLLLPYTESGLENSLRTDDIVESVEYTNDGIKIKCTIDGTRWSRYERFQIED